MKRILIDADPGIDDALALALAFRSPELSVVGVSVVNGNCSVEKGAANALRILDVLNPSPRPPVAMGADQPLFRPRIGAEHVHGGDGLGGATKLRNPDGSMRYPPSAAPLDKRHAVELILDAADEETALAAFGPLTNIALAARADARRMRRYQELVVMGGAFRTAGNISPHAEFNVYADPHALEEVLSAGLRPTFIPLDATSSVLLRPQTLAEARGSLGRFTRDISDILLAFTQKAVGVNGMHVHDALVIAYLLDESMFRLEHVGARVETAEGASLGRTYEETDETPNARAAFEADEARILDLLKSRVLGL